MRIFSLSFFLAAAAFAGVGAEPGRDVSLPLRNVILYSSGVGAFEHSGKIPEGESGVTFRVSKEQLNDLLKSLTVSAESQRNISIRSVNYPTELPLGSLMKNTRVDMSAVNSLSSLLKNMRGNEFSVSSAGGLVFSGRLVGVETRDTPFTAGGSTVFAKKDYATFMTDGGFRTAAVSDLTGIVPADPALFEEMKDALARIAGYNAKTDRPLKVNLSAKKESGVRISYVIESPVWKASYRLVTDDSKKNFSFLQGWALVENPTGSVWKNVHLSLISGRPESFVQDLYTSIYLVRPVVRRENYAGVKPLRHAVSSVPASAAKFDAVSTSSFLKEKENVRYSPVRKTMFRRTMNSLAGGSAETSAEKIGALCRFDISEPVTLGSRESAMLNLVSADVKTEKTDFYSMRTRGTRPLNAVVLENTTDRLLPQGPVTVFDGAVYGGDASLSDLAAGQKQILSYGLDLEVPVVPGSAMYKPGYISELSIERGVMRLRGIQTYETGASFTNTSGKDKILLFEIPKIDGGKVVSELKPSEETATDLRFRIKLPAGRKTDAAIRIELPLTEVVSVNPNMDFSILTNAASGAKLAPAVRKKMEMLAAVSSEIRNLERRISLSGKKVQDLSARHERTRRSLESIGSGDYRNTLLKRLADFDSKLDTEYRLHEGLNASLLEKRTQFDNLLNKFSGK